MRARWIVAALMIVEGALAPAAIPARAQDVPAAPGVPTPSVPAALDAPWTDVAPRLEAEHVLAAAVGMPDERLGRLAARRAAARRSGEERARAMIHRWADDALAQVAASASIAGAVHRAIDERATVARVRPLSDGGAVIEVAVPLAALRAAAAQRGLPW